MHFKIPPKVAAINSFAGYGRCSVTELLPILSVMGVQACPVPTAVFSNHTGFSSFYCQDLTAQMPDYLAQWEQLGLVFDGISCGFLGKEEQIPAVAGFIGSQKQKGCPMVLIDPVMGDHGRPYRTVTPKHCLSLKNLVKLADIITPNITEACLLTDTPWKEDIWSDEELQQICEKLHALGPAKIAVTGLFAETKNGEGFSNFLSCKNGFSTHFSRCDTPSAGPSRHGTGDIFAAILTADAVNGVEFSRSVQKASDFIADCIRVSEALSIPEPEGVCFENLLGSLLPDSESGRHTGIY